MLLIFRILRKDKNQSTDEVSARKYRKTVAGMERKKLAKKKNFKKIFPGLSSRCDMFIAFVCKFIRLE